MDTPLQIFEPIQRMSPMLIVCLPIVVGAMIFYYFNAKREVAYEDRNQRNMFSMLAVVAALVAFSAGAMDWIINRNVGPIELYVQKISYSSQIVEFSEVKGVYIRNDAAKQGRPTGRRNKEKLLLVIEEYNGKGHYFYDRNYDIKQMVSAISQQVKAYKNKEKEKGN